MIPPIWGWAADFSGGLAAVEVDGRIGFINRRGNLVIAPRFAYAEGFRGGRARVLEDDSGDSGGAPAWINRLGRVVWRDDENDGTGAE